MKTILLFLFLCVSCFLPCTGQTDWKKTLTDNSFVGIKKKQKIPKEIFKRAGIESLNRIANPGQSWNSDCTISEKDRTSKFNWAYTDQHNWILSITTGGYMVQTHYYLIPAYPEKITEVRGGGFDMDSFETFKKKYFADSLYGGSRY
jgi:hypothetical protein